MIPDETINSEDRVSSHRNTALQSIPIPERNCQNVDS